MPELRIFLLMGQSNMAGRGEMDALPPITDERIRMWRDGEWLRAEEPLHDDRPEGVGAGLAMSFAVRLLHEAPQSPIGLVPCAVGGTGLDRWLPGADLYRRALERAAGARAAGRLAAALWHQGENDAADEAKARSYGERLERMIRALRADLGIPELPFVAGELADCLALVPVRRHYPLINEALRSVGERVENYACARADGLVHKEGDPHHLNTPSLREFGRRYAECYLRIAEAP